MIASDSARSKALRWLLIAAAALVLLLIAGSLVLGPLLGVKAKKDLVRSLGEATHSDVTIEKVSVAFTPQVRIAAENLAFRYAGRTDVPPIAQLSNLTMYASFFGMFGKGKHFTRLVLDNLQVTIPPDRNKGRSRQEPEQQGRTRIDEILMNRGVLRVLHKEADKQPWVFEIHEVDLRPVDKHRAMTYRVELRNPKPPGLVRASGSFGPLDPQHPETTPLSGTYRFENADLGVFRNIGGVLSSAGKFAGPLNRIEVAGAANVAQFKLRIGEHPVPVHADFNATVDGTNGNTLLHPATLHFLHSTIVANGGVVSAAGHPGKTVTLDAVVHSGRVDDFLHVMTKPKEPFMTGPTVVRAHIVVPPGPRRFLDKLHVSGVIGIGTARYNRPKVQENVDKLSERAEGDPNGDTESAVNSDVHGQCTIDGAVVHVSEMLFRVPGVAATAKGTYGLRSHALNFTGSMRTIAKASEMTTGWKSALLKVVDPFLKRKNAGAEIPIQVTGTQEHPNFSVRKKL